MAQKTTNNKTVLARRAIRISQNEHCPIYLLSVTGEELFDIADISRVGRSDAGELIGYQRPEVKRHVNDIVEYLDQKDVIFPNAIILSFSSSVSFKKSRGPLVDDGLSSVGTLEIPFSSTSKPGWIVDGQQRALALSKTTRSSFPIAITAFVTNSLEIQRVQFIRINSSKPLPNGLITELLPEISANLPSRLAVRKIPSALCEKLNSKSESPFFELIRRPSLGSSETAVIADNSITKMLQDSLNSTAGCLFPYRNLVTGETDFETIWSILNVYWTAVRNTFPEAWGLPPTKSRLMHGAGIRAMGKLMDRIMSPISVQQKNSVELAEKELRRIKPICRWTSGHWEELGNLPWNAIENTPRSIKLLSSLLVREYTKSKTTT